MIRQALVIIDDEVNTEKKISFCARLAKSYKLRLSGLGAIDTKWIHSTQLEPLTGTKFIANDDEEVVAITQKVKASLEEFYHRLHKQGIAVSTMSVEGDPYNEIRRLSEEYDMLITSAMINFHHDPEEPNYDNFLHLARQSVRPIYVINGLPKRSKNVIFAFDGSTVSSRAIHMYIMMGLAKGKNIHLVSVDKDSDKVQDQCRQITRLANAHNLKPETHAIVSEIEPAEKIIEIAEATNAAEIVVGAFGSSKWREFLLGSCLKTLLRKSHIPLFIHQ